jgi:flagellin FlaB
MFRRIRGLSREAWSQQSGITGLETAIVLIAFIVVAAVFAFAVLTTGLFSTETAKQTALTGLSQATSTLASRGSITAGGDTGNKVVGTIKFRLTVAAGNDSVGLAPANTLVSFFDQNNQVNLLNTADGSLTTSGDTFWYHTWLLGEGDSVEPGEVVEFTIGVGGLATADGGTKALGANTTFKIEVIPAEGAVVVLGRTTPLEITSIMDMD